MRGALFVCCSAVCCAHLWQLARVIVARDAWQLMLLPRESWSAVVLVPPAPRVSTPASTCVGIGVTKGPHGNQRMTL